MPIITREGPLHSGRSGSPLGSFLLLLGLLSIAVGIAILLAPDLLAFIVAGFLIFLGLSLASWAWRLRRLGL